jgi:hypothetical protein
MSQIMLLGVSDLPIRRETDGFDDLVWRVSFALSGEFIFVNDTLTFTRVSRSAFNDECPVRKDLRIRSESKDGIRCENIVETKMCGMGSARGCDPQNTESSAYC